MKKTLSIIENEPELKKLCDQIDTIGTQFREKLQFLKKQADDFRDQNLAEKKPLWDEIEKIMLESGRLPKDYSQEKFTIEYDKEDGTLVLIG